MQLLKNLIKISSITLVSRILGFIRDTIIARIFGAEMLSDAFFTAFKIPNLLRRIFAEGALSQAFIPVLSEYKNQHSQPMTRMFFSYVVGLLIIVLLIIICIGILCAPWIIMFIAPGFIHIPKKFILTVSLLRITLPYIIFISLSSLIGAVLNVWNFFSIPACTPIILNISMITAILFCTPYFNPSITALAWSVIIGGLLQLFYQLPYLKKINMLILPKLKLYNLGVWKIIKQMGSSIIGISVSQISLIMNTIFASFLVSGSLSWIYYADRLMELPSGVLGVALGTILLPLLSNSFIQNNYEEYSNLLDWSLKLCFLFTLPSAIILGVLANPVIVTLFQYGKFSSFDTLMTQHSLIAYSIGLIGIILVKIFVPAFYSQHNIKTPIRIAVITLTATQFMNFIFVGPLKHAGLSLSIGLAANLNAILLYWQLRKQKIFQPNPGWGIFLLRIFFAAIIMTTILLISVLVGPNYTQYSMLLRIIHLFILILFGVIIYFVTLWGVGCRLYHFQYNKRKS